MKILFHCSEYPPAGGGVGAYVSNMAQALGQTGHTAFVVTARTTDMPEQVQTPFGQVFRLIPAADLRTPRAAQTVLDLARDLGVDVIEGADHGGDCAPVLKCTDRPPVLIKLHACHVLNVLLAAHVYYPWQRFTIALARLRVRHQMWAERYSIEHADAITVPSERLLKEVRRQGLRLPQTVSVLPNPIPVEPPEKAVTRGDPVLLFVGRIEFCKGIQYLASILHDVLRDFPSARLEIAGDDNYARGVGSLKVWLKRELAGLHSHVRFLGRLDREQLKDAYRRAWVVLFPSRWDNFPTVVLEAMMMSRPVVASPHGGMPEMLAETGCPIVDPASPEFARFVSHMLGDPTRRAIVGAAVHRRAVERYSPQAIVPAYVKVLEHVIASDPTATR